MVPDIGKIADRIPGYDDISFRCFKSALFGRFFNSIYIVRIKKNLKAFLRVFNEITICIYSGF